MTAALAWVVFALLPGAALALSIQPSLRHRPVLLASVAPGCSFALAIATAQALRWAGHGPWPGAAVVDAAVVIAATTRIAMVLRRRATAGPDTEDCAASGDTAPQGREELAAARWLLAAALVTGIGLWVSGVQPSIPPNADSQNHGYFVARIVEHNTLDPAVVLTQSPSDPTPMARYYPLSIHVTVAIAHQSTGIPIASLLTAWTAMTAAVCLPCGLFVLVRRLLPDRPVTAGLAALLGTTVALFPYQPMVWGGLALVIGMSLVPGALSACLVAIDAHGWAPTALGALAVAGTTLAHPSEVALLVLLLAAFLLGDLVAARPRGDLGRRARRWLGLTAACAVLLAPWALAAATGTSERTGHLSNGHGSLLGTAARLVTFDIDNGVAQPVVGVLLVVGVVVVLVRRPFAPLRPMVLVMGALAVLFLATTVDGVPWEQLRPATVPWYRSAWRLLYNVALFAPVFVAVALESARRLARDRLSVAGSITTASVAGLAVVLTLPAAHTTLRFAFSTETLLGPEEVSLIEELGTQFDAPRGLGSPTATGGEQLDPRPFGSTVLNQRHDATTWMYAIAGLPAFSGIAGYERSPDHADRRYVVEHLADAANDPREQALLRHFDARYVMVNDRTFLDYPPDITSEQLREAGYRVVDHRGDLWLFEIPPY